MTATPVVSVVMPIRNRAGSPDASLRSIVDPEPAAAAAWVGYEVAVPAAARRSRLRPDPEGFEQAWLRAWAVWLTPGCAVAAGRRSPLDGAALRRSLATARGAALLAGGSR